MRILIWISIKDAMSGTVSKFYNRNPQPTVVEGGDYVQVEITRDEFVLLIDNKK